MQKVIKNKDFFFFFHFNKKLSYALNSNGKIKSA